jgi:Spy/CpxP family protein refolding chaperone
MKKYVAAAALIGAIGFASFSMADARGNYGYGPGPGYGDCGGYGYCNNLAITDADNEKTSAFVEETKETRKEIFVKRSELDALMSQDNPDEKKVAKLTGEIYDLQAFMEEKVVKAFGDSPRYGYGRGRGGNGNCRGPRNW